MKRVWLGFWFLVIPAPAAITWTTAAAVSSKKGTVKAARKVAGK